MAMNKPIIIQKLNAETEEWQNYYSCFAEVNKSSGKEYFNAKTNITENTFNFKVRYIEKLSNIVFDTTGYRIIYKKNVFNIINADDKQERHINITLVANCITI